MPKDDFKEYICRPHCLFFKEGEKEEIACRGAQIIEVLVNRNRIHITEIPPLKKEPALWQKYKEGSGECICGQCSFRAEDCDFQSETSPEDTEPCGGFILLVHLKENKLIDESDFIPYST